MFAERCIRQWLERIYSCIPRSRTEHNEGKRLIKSRIHLRRPRFSSSVASAPSPVRMLCSKRFERFRNTRARGAVSSIFGRSSPAHVVYPGFVVFDRGNGFREINQSSAPASRSLIVYTFYLSSLVAYTWHLTVSSYRARSRLPARYFSPPSTFFDYITLLVLFLPVDETRYRIICVVFINDAINVIANFRDEWEEFLRIFSKKKSRRENRG